LRKVGHARREGEVIDDAPAIAARYSVQAVPTLLIVHAGRELARHMGPPPSPAALRQWVEEALRSKQSVGL
jgi:thioredoxin 2